MISMAGSMAWAWGGGDNRNGITNLSVFQSYSSVFMVPYLNRKMISEELAVTTCGIRHFPGDVILVLCLLINIHDDRNVSSDVPDGPK